MNIDLHVWELGYVEHEVVEMVGVHTAAVEPSVTPLLEVGNQAKMDKTPGLRFRLAACYSIPIRYSLLLQKVVQKQFWVCFLLTSFCSYVQSALRSSLQPYNELHAQN